jgi:general secretion pathway protein K
MWRLMALRRDERGIALVMVIWVLALLSLMAVSFLAEARVEVRRAGNLRARAEAEALAEAGINIAVARLIAEHGETHPQPWTESIGGGSVTLTVIDEHGKIDLNESDPELLRGLLKSEGVPTNTAHALAQAIVDFRDPDHDVGPQGAEDGDYPVGSSGAKDDRFETVDELLQVRGMTPALYARIAPLVTVHSVVPVIDPLTADRRVLAAVPGMDQAELARFLRLRAELAPILNAPVPTDQDKNRVSRERRSKVMTQLRAAVPQRNSVTRFFLSDSFGPPTFEVITEAQTAQGGHFRREAILRLDPDGSSSFQLLEWRRPQ